MENTEHLSFHWFRLLVTLSFLGVSFMPVEWKHIEPLLVGLGGVAFPLLFVFYLGFTAPKPKCMRNQDIPQFTTAEEIRKWLRSLDRWYDAAPQGMRYVQKLVPVAEAPYELVDDFVEKIHYPFNGQNFGYVETPNGHPVVLYVQAGAEDVSDDAGIR